MNREKACVTADGKLQVPSLSGQSLHEYSATEEGILYRLAQIDGTPLKGRPGLWKLLLPDNVLKHLVSCEWQPTAATWFKHHGITIERLRAEREAERKKKLRDAHRKTLKTGSKLKH